MPLARLKDPSDDVCCGSCDEDNMFLRLLPVVAVFLVTAWSYYVYVYEFCCLVIGEDDLYRMIGYLLNYHIILVYCIVLMILVMFLKGQPVPDKYFIPPEFYCRLERECNSSRKYEMLLRFCREREIRIYTRTVTGNIRYCRTCKVVRPDRSHHCSTCGVCVLKMDHHCPWINNCIGFHNHKYFINYLIACCIYCIFYFATTIETCFNFFFYKEEWTIEHLRKIHIIICAFTMLVIGIIIGCLFFFHLYLILTNQTTIESMTPPTFAAPYEVGFNKGLCENFYEQCTCNPAKWCVPINTMSGNGVDFDVVRLD